MNAKTSLRTKRSFFRENLLTAGHERKVSPSACRDVAQSGSALEWGSRGRRFKSFHPDQHIKRELPQGISGSWFPFHRVSPKNAFASVSPTPLFTPLRSFSFRAPQATYRDFQRFLHRADNGSRWNPQSLCKPNKGFHPDPGLSLFETPQPRIVNARLLSQSIAAQRSPSRSDATISSMMTFVLSLSIAV